MRVKTEFRIINIENAVEQIRDNLQRSLQLRDDKIERLIKEVGDLQETVAKLEDHRHGHGTKRPGWEFVGKGGASEYTEYIDHPEVR